MSKAAGHKFLPPLVRVLLVFAILIVGCVPSFLFFAWVERNCALPFIPQEAGWPWLYLDLPLWGQVIWNSGLFLGFGLVHSVLAAPGVNKLLSRAIPNQALRATYMIASGICLWSVMALWQHTGIVVWEMGLPPRLTQILSFSIFWCLMILALMQIKRFDLWHFMGLKQVYSRPNELEKMVGSEDLVTTGWYAHFRHPTYFFTCMAFLLTPFMTLDRLTVAIVQIVYLWLAIPHEEAKLITLFGQKYVDYQKRVPALFPRLKGIRTDK